jgi:hypothetical protein
MNGLATMPLAYSLAMLTLKFGRLQVRLERTIAGWTMSLFHLPRGRSSRPHAKQPTMLAFVSGRDELPWLDLDGDGDGEASLWLNGCSFVIPASDAEKVAVFIGEQCAAGKPTPVRAVP